MRNLALFLSLAAAAFGQAGVPRFISERLPIGRTASYCYSRPA